MNLQYKYLFQIEPLPNEDALRQELIDCDEEIDYLQKELSEIATDKIPFDKTDAVVVFALAMIEVAADTLLADPNCPDSVASQCNDSKSVIGKWCNNIHERIDHTNNPLDNQGSFDATGKFYQFGEKVAKGQKISFGGGDHRERTYGHDLLRFMQAIKQYHDGQFVDGGYINGQYVEIISNINQYGNIYEKLSWPKAIWEYVCHMFADFFSSKGLPCPGWSWLSHADDRQIREAAADLYKDGMNLRTELLKSIAVMFPEIGMRIVQYLRYKDSEYSKEAKLEKLNLMLLMTHGIATAVNVEKVVITENPASLNLPMILRTLKLVVSCIKDSKEYNHRVILKTSMDTFRSQLELKRTIIITFEGIYYTAQVQSLAERLKEENDRRVRCRIEQAFETANILSDYEIAKGLQLRLLTDNSKEIAELSSQLKDLPYDNEKSLAEIMLGMPSAMEDENVSIESLMEKID